MRDNCTTFHIGKTLLVAIFKHAWDSSSGKSILHFPEFRKSAWGASRQSINLTFSKTPRNH